MAEILLRHSGPILSAVLTRPNPRQRCNTCSHEAKIVLESSIFQIVHQMNHVVSLGYVFNHRNSNRGI